METIHYSRCRMVPTPSSLAYQLGYLDELNANDAGVSVKLEFGDYNHQDDRLWMRHASNGKSIWARSQGADTRIVALSSCESAWPIVARAGSGIETPRDLKGRRVLIPSVEGRAFDVERHLYIKAFVTGLASAGLGLADVQVVDLPFTRPTLRDAPPEPKHFFEVASEAALAKLAAGEVDAVVAIQHPALASPDFHIVYDARRDDSPWARGEMRTLVASGALLREHREVVVAAVATLLAAADWARAHPDDVQRLVARDVQMSPEELRRQGIDFDPWPDVDCSPAQVALMRARKDYMLAIGAIPNDFSVEDWIDTSIVPSARERLAMLRAANTQA